VNLIRLRRESNRGASGGARRAHATTYSIGSYNLLYRVLYSDRRKGRSGVGTINVAAMNKTLTVLLIEDSPDYAALVQQWLSVKTSAAFVLHWADSLQSGLDRLKQGGVDAILLDLDLPDSSGIGTFTRTKRQAAGVPVILLTGDSGEQFALQLVQKGAQDYIVKGSCNAESLVKALQYAVVRSASCAEPNAQAEEASVLGVMGVKGGVGNTTVACNLAVELRLQTDQKTLLLDLDLEGGMVSFFMNAESEYTVQDATTNVDRLDASVLGGWWRMVQGTSRFWDHPVCHGLPSRGRTAFSRSWQ